MKIICIKNCYTDKYHSKGEILEIAGNKKIPVHFKKLNANTIKPKIKGLNDSLEGKLNVQ